MKKWLLGVVLPLAILLVSCNIDEEVNFGEAPRIELSGSGVYELKLGETLTISPRVESAEGASYKWTLDGKKVGAAASYRFKAEQVGTFYLTLEVSNEMGSDKADFRIEVVALQLPVVSLAVGADGRMELLKGREYELLSSVANSKGAKYEWSLDGKVVGEEPSLSVQIDQNGEYQLSLKVRNDDGEAEATATLCVVERLAPALSCGAAKRYVSLGRALYIEAVTENFLSPEFSWSVDGEAVEGGKVLAFEPAAEGEYCVEVVATDSDGMTLTARVQVVCCAEEGAYRREATAESQRSWSRLFEYTPAPGQFINEDKSGFAGEQSAEAAVKYAEKRLQSGGYLSLGGWGGYVVVGFDHSIANGSGSDFVIRGNMHEGSSEAGVVWVSQDTNGNGQPDDEWYELRGSEYDKPTSWRDYAVTYYRPAAEQMDVLWRDNRGGAGRIARMDAHKQAHYFPAWVEGAEFTLRGTRLKDNTTLDSVTGNYVNAPFAWGYADNLGSDLGEGGGQVNEFDIANAVTAGGHDADLQYIDFVKVQTAINHSAGHLGEISTEVCGIEIQN